MSVLAWVGLVSVLLTIRSYFRERRRGWRRITRPDGTVLPRRSAASTGPRGTPPARVGAGIAAAFLGRQNRMLAATLSGLALRGAVALTLDETAPAGRRIRVRVLPVDDVRSPEEGPLRRALAPTVDRTNATNAQAGGSTGAGADADAAGVVLDARALPLRGRLRAWTIGTLRRAVSLGFLERSTGLGRFWGAVLAIGGFALPLVDLLRSMLIRDGSVVTIVIDAILAATMIGLLATAPLIPSRKGWALADRLEAIDRFFTADEATRHAALRRPPSGTASGRNDSTTGGTKGVDPADPAQLLRAYERLLPYAVVLRRGEDWVAVLRATAGLDPDATLVAAGPAADAALAPGAPPGSAPDSIAPEAPPLWEIDLAAIARYLVDRDRRAALKNLYTADPDERADDGEDDDTGFGY